MKKSFIKKISALFTTLLLCFCTSSIQLDESALSETIQNRTNVKRSNNPFDDTDDYDTLDMRSIKLDWFEEGSTIETYMQYSYVFNSSTNTYNFYSQNDSDDKFFYISLNSSYELILHVSTNLRYNVSYIPKGFVLPLLGSLDDYSNSLIHFYFSDFNYSQINYITLGTFDPFISLEDNYINSLPSFGASLFNPKFDLIDDDFRLNKVGYESGFTCIPHNTDTNLYLYINFDTPLSLKLPSGQNYLTFKLVKLLMYSERFPHNLSFPLGKLHIYCDIFPHNSVYTNEPDNIYQNGFDIGFQKGIEKGESVGAQNVIDNSYGGKTYQEIYNIGYNTGYSQGHDADNYVPQLFEGIVNIPISVLNGLAPLTFFDLSVIRVIITILAMSVIIWLISYIMSTKG